MNKQKIRERKWKREFERFVLTLNDRHPDVIVSPLFLTGAQTMIKFYFTGDSNIEYKSGSRICR